ncbi:DUF484 family protein [Parashewanella curva]|uniref:DUF484 family protein n=1 Tax=Parashewanella curva TaxID=2338552 RepID=A0A3L8PZR9_9GAMM|nr:DUF484 family protein [Parashewanella curva]RLV60279.1 DUF484 family protein [Parashewanella curva]
MTSALTPKEKICAELDEQLVYEYLSDHPDFFNRYPNLLHTLKLPHQQRGTVSIVERQQETLRQRVVQLEEEITALMSAATNNERIFRFNSQLVLDLYKCDDFDTLKQTLSTALKSEFGFSNVRLIAVQDIDTEMMTLWNKRMHSGYYLGRLTQTESQKLFGSQVGSVALSKLTPKSGCDKVILAIASPNAAHFTPDMDTLFLEQLKTIITLKLSSFQ